MRRALVVALALGAIVPRVALAKKPKPTAKDKHTKVADNDQDDDQDSDAGSDKADAGKDAGTDDAKDDDADDDDGGSDQDDDAGSAKAGAKGNAKADDTKDDGSDSDDDSSSTAKPAAEPTPDQLVKKQDLTGHDMGGTHKPTSFEKNRFFVDKLDTKKTRKTTLIQGSITSSTFAYAEAGGSYGGNEGTDSSKFSRFFTDLRLQTDFRHISGGRWDARVDARLRFVNSPSPSTPGYTPATTTSVQSGLIGQNEYDLRELWAVRNGDRTDVFIGRQFIPDLGAVKIDGVRFDYASSNKLTFVGFGGLYPLRGSRSLSTDYIPLKKEDGTSAGQFVGAAGFGGAYRTPVAYGAVGAVALAPFAAESPRIFLTSNGYWRYGSKLDLYHFAIIDLIGNNDALGAGHAGLTNLSVGANIKPTDRLRINTSYNRVDTETLNVQAYAYLSQPDTNVSVVQNEVYIERLSTNELRASISAGLGPRQRFDLTAAAAYRFRPSFSLTAPGTMMNGQPGMPAVSQSLPAQKSAELNLMAVDRHSILDMRLGAEVVQTFGLGSVAYDRTELFAVRLFARRDIREGRGEWSAEAAYSSSKDTSGAANGMPAGACTGVDALNNPITSCFGRTTGTLLSVGGQVYYRLDRDWYGVLDAYLTHTDLKYNDPTITTPTLSPILGLSGFVRVAYRF